MMNGGKSCFSVLIIRFGRHFFRPPSYVYHTELLVPFPPLTDGFFEMRLAWKVIAVEDTILYIVTGGTAEGKEGFTLYRVDLATHQMINTVPDTVRLTAVKRHRFKFTVQAVKIFVVAVNEYGSKGLFIERLKPLIFRAAVGVGIPDTAEISADDDNIVFCHVLLLRKGGRGKLIEF